MTPWILVPAGLSLICWALSGASAITAAGDDHDRYDTAGLIFAVLFALFFTAWTLEIAGVKL